MGYYIDPEGQSKEQWLAENATPATQQQAGDADFDSKFPVVLIDNGIFTAAGIAYDKREFEAFTSPNDHRSKKFFLADREKLTPFCGRLKIGE